MSHCGDGVAKVKQGADAEFTIGLTQSKDGGPEQVFVLTPIPTKLELSMPKSDGGTLRLNLAGVPSGTFVEDADGGIVKVKMDEDTTNLLKGFDPDSIEFQNMELEIVQDIPEADTTTIFDLSDALSVAVRRFPPV